MSEIQTESRKALRELLDDAGGGRPALGEPGVEPPGRGRRRERAPRAHAHARGRPRHLLRDRPARPRFQRIVSPTRKFTGDNADAIYYDAPVSPEHGYRVRGRMDGAVYVSFTVECDTADGSMATRTGGVLNDTQFDVDARRPLRDPPRRAAGAAQLARARAARATRITTRHYYENERRAAADPTRNAALEIERARAATPPPPAPNDASVARGIRRVAHVRAQPHAGPAAAWRRPSSRRSSRIVAEPVPQAGAARRTSGSRRSTPPTRWRRT